MLWAQSTLPQSLKLSKNQALSVYSELVKTVSGKFECLMCQLYIPWTRCLSHFVLVLLLLWVLISWSRGCVQSGPLYVCSVLCIFLKFVFCFMLSVWFGHQLFTQQIVRIAHTVRFCFTFGCDPEQCAHIWICFLISECHDCYVSHTDGGVVTAMCLIMLDVSWLPCVS